MERRRGIKITVVTVQKEGMGRGPLKVGGRGEGALAKYVRRRVGVFGVVY